MPQAARIRLLQVLWVQPIITISLPTAVDVLQPVQYRVQLLLNKCISPLPEPLEPCVTVPVPKPAAWCILQR